jgi:hypothetical protein
MRIERLLAAIVVFASSGAAGASPLLEAAETGDRAGALAELEHGAGTERGYAVRARRYFLRAAPISTNTIFAGLVPLLRHA